MTIQTPLDPALWPTERKMRFLAKELAVDIVEPAKICETMEIDIDEWDAIIQHPQFRIMLQEEKERWNSTLNIKERVDLKTWAILEDALHPVPAVPAQPDVQRHGQGSAILGTAEAGWHRSA
jgi:hypothetical protein